MAIYRPKEPVRVALTWRDICSTDGGWHDRKQLKPDPGLMQTTGWLVYEDEESIMLAMDWDAQSKRYAGVATYPKAVVESTHALVEAEDEDTPEEPGVTGYVYDGRQLIDTNIYYAHPNGRSTEAAR